MEDLKLISKEEDEKLSSEKLEQFLGEYVYCSKNELYQLNTDEEKVEKVNVWFAGRVAGFRETRHIYDYRKDVFLKEPTVVWEILLVDGKSYMVSDDCVMNNISEDTFMEMVAKEDVNEYLAVKKAKGKDKRKGLI